MARTGGIIPLRGSMGGITFYRVGNRVFARQKSSLDAQRLKSDPAFERTLENAAEFALATRAGKALRQAASRIYPKALGKRVMLKVNQVMLKMKMLDETSPRGQRNAGAVQYQPEAQLLLKGFDLGTGHLDRILKGPVMTDATTGQITIQGLNPGKGVLWPEGASHLVLSGCVARVDLAQGTYTAEKTNEVMLEKNGPVSDVQLMPETLPGGTGLFMLFLRMYFVQEKNGGQYVLEDEDFDVCAVVEVG